MFGTCVFHPFDAILTPMLVISNTGEGQISNGRQS